MRIVCRNYKGRKLFYAQLVQEGHPKQKKKNKIKSGKSSLDIGPSTYAFYTPEMAELDQFCAELDPLHQEISSLQRKMDRSRRVTNPKTYNRNGTVKTGAQSWVKSNRYKDLKLDLSELYRRLAAARKTMHGTLANKLLAYGNVFYVEKLSYKAFQKMYGKSIGFRAPGMFVSMLRRKAESAGGEVVDLSAGTLKLSQMCQCGNQQKKPLSERWHKCPNCGITAQRDLYSAFLANHVTDDVLDRELAIAAWLGAESLLKQAMSRLQRESANAGNRVPQSFGLGRSKSGLPAKGSYTGSDNRDDVALAFIAAREPLKRAVLLTPRTLRL